MTAAAGAEQPFINLKPCADICMTCLLADLAACCMQERLLLVLLWVMVLSCSTCARLLNPAEADACVLLLLLARPRMQSCAALSTALLS
jgi:hypothetical protein